MAAGTAAFALATGLACGVAAIGGRPISRTLGLALGAVELAILSVVLVHAEALVSGAAPATPKQIAYLLAGALLLPALVLGTGVTGRSRSLTAAIGCLATVVLALRIQVVA